MYWIGVYLYYCVGICVVLKLKKLHKDAIIPQYQTEGSVGFDLHSITNLNLKSGEKAIIKTGLAVEVPKGYEMQVRQRSGLSISYPSYICIGVGTIDSDYRGEIIIPVINNNAGRFIVRKGDRIAQGIIAPVIQCEIKEVEELNETERGQNGFGSTGKK